MKKLKTKRDWIEYAMKLEEALLLRPNPKNYTDEQWIKEYQDWYYDVVVTLWEEFDTTEAQKELAA